MSEAKKDKLPLGIVVPYPFLPPIGGGQLVNYRISHAFAKRYPSIILSSKENKKEKGLHVHRLFHYVKLNYINPLLAIRFYRFLKKQPVKALFCNHPFLGFVLYPACQLLNIPLYLYQHNIEYLRFKALGKKTASFVYYLEKFTCRHAEAIFFISKDEIQTATKLYGINPAKCYFLPHFLTRTTAPNNRLQTRSAILQKHAIKEDDYILLFFGPLDYPPNSEAVDFILDNIYPQLEVDKHHIQILICGGGMSEAQQIRLSNQKNVHYLGFVDKIEDYIQTADLILAPLFRGGGVKTKVIESIEWGTSVLTTPVGAEGIAQATCADKLIVLGDSTAFAKTILELKKQAYQATPSTFYEFYHVDNVLKSAMNVMDL